MKNRAVEAPSNEGTSRRTAAANGAASKAVKTVSGGMENGRICSGAESNNNIHIDRGNSNVHINDSD